MSTPCSPCPQESCNLCCLSKVLRESKVHEIHLNDHDPRIAPKGGVFSGNRLWVAWVVLGGSENSPAGSYVLGRGAQLGARAHRVPRRMLGMHSRCSRCFVHNFATPLAPSALFPPFTPSTRSTPLTPSTPFSLSTPFTLSTPFSGSTPSTPFSVSTPSTLSTPSTPFTPSARFTPSTPFTPSTRFATLLSVHNCSLHRSHRLHRLHRLH